MPNDYLEVSVDGLPTLEPGVLAKTLASFPFICVEGLFNIRDIGGYASSYATPGHTSSVKRGFYYRSGEPSLITNAGKDTLRSLGIRTAFDFRTEAEIKKWAAPGLDAIEGAHIQVVRVGLDELTNWNETRMEDVLAAFEKDETNTFLRMYAAMIEGFATSFEIILRDIIRHPDQPCLFHCTAGKDRTGIFVALLLLLLGVSDADIAQDYSLTEIGLQPAIPQLSARMKKIKVYADNWQGTANMARARPETMLSVLRAFREKYGSVEEYIESRTTLTAEDVEKLRTCLLVEDKASK
ncbi:protein-tyrosine phosphatase-like protein [Lyophyllum atratum]|nr:protein-tyrosine phosphatase-like protein [Lyophyllum atratum]